MENHPALVAGTASKAEGATFAWGSNPRFSANNSGKGGAWMGRVIATDFDGTLCEQAFPEIGKANTELIKCLIDCRNYGDKIILWTCRHDEALVQAVEWCRKNGLEFDAVNDNLPERIRQWENNGRKVSADIYIDDQSYGAGRFAECIDLLTEARIRG